MTPTWRKKVKFLLADTSPHALRALEAVARCRCFDLRPSEELLHRTASELSLALIEAAQQGVVGLDLGHRAVVPADNCWVEWSEGFVIFEKVDKGPGIENYTIMLSGDGFRGIGDLCVFSDGFAWRVGNEEEWLPLFTLPEQHPARKMSILGLAAIAIINSPSAAEERVDPHRGLARKLSKSAPDRAIKHVRILIGKASGRRQAVTTPNPSAYHFVRAHAREFSPGRTTRVRAHWRGDPAYGIRLPSYEVRF